MKDIGFALMLGLILVSVVGFAYWLRGWHRLAPQWQEVVDRGLDQVDGLGEPAAPNR